MNKTLKISTKALIALCAATMLATGCAQNRTIGGNVDDAAADIALKANLVKDEKYDYSDVDITVFEARVMLTGSMRTEEGKAHLERLAQNSPNVKQVINEIIVGEKTSFQQGTRDALIDQRLAAALLTDTGVVRRNYQFTVSNGVVYMLGVAQGPTELTRATEQARRIDGVKKVVSHVMYVGDPSRVTR
ncbi:BON domain-containing protein [Parvularcula flava]|uniref:BON domain-containing protein n=1 Tax=Aquisalinus luteolus TaxID=1566827 RepID=A0A8J3A7Y4_9PROT|nr:BON domain-containing protein [Aquisalinus luteolus]NHK28187.1 BON domain-containing protein [Aquisalinus luteolus]GGH97726.1 BON domain-containing protein [Aquisalinus luteolus]